MKKTFIIYDDILQPNLNISNVIGECKFGEILYKRSTIKERLIREIDSVMKNQYEMISLKKVGDLQFLTSIISQYDSNIVCIVIKSHGIIVDPEKFSVFLSKTEFVDKVMYSSSTEPLITVLPNKVECIKYFENYNSSHFESTQDEVLSPSNFLIDISEFQSFITFFSGGFEARHFNSMSGDEFSLIKASKDKTKMHREYSFYHLLPENMKFWFVMPYDYKEQDSNASYMMERYNIPDMALQWIHGAVTRKELETFMRKAFRFINGRPKRVIEKDTYKQLKDNLYLIKLRDRIKMLKELDEYKTIAKLISSGTRYDNIDEILAEYEELYTHITSEDETISVIGHGDFCFSNILYDKQANLMRLIDPKGASLEEDLWTNQYYDIAKLSHSILGDYDYINSGMFRIEVNEECELELIIDQRPKLELKSVFLEALDINGYDVKMIRLFETSLFLSMIPLHIDHPQKVIGFILNAIKIMKEIKQNVD